MKVQVTQLTRTTRYNLKPTALFSMVSPLGDLTVRRQAQCPYQGLADHRALTKVDSGRAQRTNRRLNISRHTPQR